MYKTLYIKRKYKKKMVLSMLPTPRKKTPKVHKALHVKMSSYPPSLTLKSNTLDKEDRAGTPLSLRQVYPTFITVSRHSHLEAYLHSTLKRLH